MTTNRILCLTVAALLASGPATLSLATPSPQSRETAAEPPSATPASDQDASLPSLQETAALTANPFANPFAGFGPAGAGEDGAAGAEPTAAAAPLAYPAGAPAPRTPPSEWAPTHFELEGFAQWRNLSADSNISTSYCLPSGCVNNTASFGNSLGLTGFGVGGLVRFIWKPEKTIRGATSKIWMEYGQINRSRTRTISGSITLLGTTYTINTGLQVQLQTPSFELGYAPRWGNDKFRIGPEIVYQRLSTNFIITNQTQNAPPPTKVSLNVPNNILLLGVDADYGPVHQFDLYGHAAFIPCCGGGWHETDTEFGAKYYLRRGFSLMGGIKYVYLKNDFNVPATVVMTQGGSISVGPFSGSIKFPGVGPFVGASVRF